MGAAETVKRVVAFLPAKGSSDRIESKNIKLLDGKPLFMHMLDNLARCQLIDQVYLDSESDEVFELASEGSHKELRRDPALATNKTDGHQLFWNEARQVEADIYVQVLCTSPFIKPQTIDKAIRILLEQPEYDSVVLVKKEKLYLWKEGGPVYDINNIPNSNTLDDTIIETMGLYVTRADVALQQKKRIGKAPFLLEAEAIEAVDVNYPEEFELAQFIMAGKREQENVKFRNLSRILNSALISDILDDLGVKGYMAGFEPNINTKKMMGRAKTLKIRELKEGEDYRGIYDALESYKTIIPGDVIVVENECPELAYFGALNANLAIRQGSVGAVIGGNTRDYNDVRQLDYAVFSRGYSAKDVRRRGTLESMNKTIKLGDVSISPGDLIFADRDGVVVIPVKLEAQVLQLAMEGLRRESKIISDIAKEIDGSILLESHGEF